MQANASASRYILVTLCVILVVTAFILIALNAFNLESRLGVKVLPGASSAQLKEQYTKGYLAAREKYKNMCPVIGRTGNSIGGTVESVSGNTIKLKQNTFDTDVNVDNVSDIRTVTVTSATKIELATRKSDEAFAKEMEAFKPSTDKPASPPSPSIVTTAKISDIKAGDNIIVTSDKELSLSSSFTALTISVSR
ncbi:MAG: hypothetical protein WC551_03540 [Patescibacteria group bacterium]